MGIRNCQRKRACGSCQAGARSLSRRHPAWIRTRPPCPLRPECLLEPAPSSPCQKTPGRNGPGGGGAGVGRVPELPPGGGLCRPQCFLSVLAPVLSCPVLATSSSPRAGVCPGPQKPEYPGCRPWPLQGQLKDPRRGRPTGLPMGPRVVLGSVSAPLFPPSLYPVFRTRGFGVFGFPLC